MNFNVIGFSSLNLPSTRFDEKDGTTTTASKTKVRTKFGQRVLWNPYTSSGGVDRDTSADDDDVVAFGRHLSSDDLEPYRCIGDDEVDDILEVLDVVEGRPLKAGDDLVAIARECWEQDNDGGHGHKEHDDGDDADDGRKTAPTLSPPTKKMLSDFYSKYYAEKLPRWVDVEQLKRGQQVLLTYLPAISSSLFYRSLIPGFSIPKIAAVLSETAYLAPPSDRTRIRHRLTDTGALLAAIGTNATSTDTATDDDDDTRVQTLLPGGDGWRTALHVRVLHAKVRRALLLKGSAVSTSSSSPKRSGCNGKSQNTNENSRKKNNGGENDTGSSRNSSSWDVHDNGVPINQEDAAATLLAFSANALLGVEMILGFPLPRYEREAFLALWRYVGWLLGVPTIHDLEDDDGKTGAGSAKRPLRPLDPCGPGWYAANRPDAVDHSYAVLQSVIFHLLDPDDSSRVIAHHLLRMGRSQDEKNGDDNWYYFRSLQCRRFVGDPLADALNLPLHPRWYGRAWLWAASTLYLVLLRFYTYASRYSPFRGAIRRFHERKLRAFRSNWHRPHLERSKQLLRSKENCCPFAMVASP